MQREKLFRKITGLMICLCFVFSLNISTIHAATCPPHTYTYSTSQNVISTYSHYYSEQYADPNDNYKVKTRNVTCNVNVYRITTVRTCTTCGEKTTTTSTQENHSQNH